MAEVLVLKDRDGGADVSGSPGVLSAGMQTVQARKPWPPARWRRPQKKTRRGAGFLGEADAIPD
ncbi:MAG: hypothetical protein QM761_14775 [Pseudoxanthomonas sp.]